MSGMYKIFYALLEILDHYSPDLIIVWGIQVTKHFKTKNIKSIADFKWRDGCGNYIFDLKYHEKQYTFINSYHPCDMYNGGVIIRMNSKKNC